MDKPSMSLNHIEKSKRDANFLMKDETVQNQFNLWKTNNFSYILKAFVQLWPANFLSPCCLELYNIWTHSMAGY